MHEILRSALEKLPENDFTQNVVFPIVRKRFPGRAEYTHGNTEGGRDIVCFTLDNLDRQKIICFQVKAFKISPGAGKGKKSLTSVYHQASQAKITKAISASGVSFMPSRVYIVTSYPFSESDRRQAEDLLKKMADEGIEVLPSDELIPILIKEFPEITNHLAKLHDPEVAETISLLASHSEARAFGLTRDRLIAEYYVPLRISPQAKLALQMVSEQVEFPNTFEYSIPWPKKKGKKLSPKELKEAIKKSLTHENCLGLPKFGDYDVVVKSIGNIWDDSFEDKVEMPEIHFQYDFEKTFKRMIKKCRELKEEIPQFFEEKPVKVIEAYNELQKLESLIKAILVQFNSFSINRLNGYRKIDFHVGSTNPLKLLELPGAVLVDGIAGCGKTTLLRALAIQHLENKGEAVFLQCCKIPKNAEHETLLQLAQKYGVGKTRKPQNTLLLIDGLDECSFDLGNQIIYSKDVFKKIICTARPAYDTSYRNFAFVIGLGRFNNEQRSNFFSKWFSNSPMHYNTVEEIVSQNRDINYHSKLPLIATLLAALVEKGEKPNSRTKVYDDRLRLLIEDWDHVRSVNRALIKDKQSVYRYLYHLAFSVHKSKKRIFRKSKMIATFEKALGRQGRNFDPDDLIFDLVVNNGIIIEEKRGYYSFGHLTFQEHLAACYLFETSTNFQELEKLSWEPWWREVLVFFASKKKDLTEFVGWLQRSGRDLRPYGEILSAMVAVAPYTQDGPFECIKEVSEQDFDSDECDEEIFEEEDY